jgi:uncharacterized membrane protein YeiH
MSALAGVHAQAVITTLDLIGVFANGLLGSTAARSQGMSPVGLAAIGIISGLGGGMIRDTLLQHGPPVALVQPAYIPTAVAGAAVAFVIQVERRNWHRVLVVVDASAISVWATAGALITLRDGLGWLPAVLLGVITAIGGGVVREVLLQKMPGAYGERPLYATVALCVASVQVLFAKELGLRDPAYTLIAIAIGIALRVVAYKRGWRLPRGLEWSAREARVKSDQLDGQAAAQRGSPVGWSAVPRQLVADPASAARDEHVSGGENNVHALGTQILIGWCATASGQTRGQVLQRLEVELDARLGEPGQRPENSDEAGSALPRRYAAMSRRAVDGGLLVHLPVQPVQPSLEMIRETGCNAAEFEAAGLLRASPCGCRA